MSVLFTAQTRQKTDSLWNSFGALSPAGQTLESPVFTVKGYAALSILVISDQAFQVRLKEAASPGGAFIQTTVQASSTDPATGLQKVALRATTSGSFAQAFIDNQGAETQKTLQVSILGLPVTGGGSGGGGGGTSGFSGFSGSSGNSGFSGIPGSGAESLDQARIIGSDFTGNVHWSAGSQAIFGALSTDTSKSYGAAYLDSASGEFRLDGTRSGAATAAPIVFRQGTGPTEYGRIVDTGASGHWTGPRFLIGLTAALFPNADIISIEKNLGDQMFVTLKNTNNNVATPAGSAVVLLNDSGAVSGGINMQNSNWPAGSTGVNPNEYACICLGGSAVYGTQGANNVRFIYNSVEFMKFDGGLLTLEVGSLLVSTGIIEATAAGATLTIGNAGAPASGGGIKAGVSGAQTLVWEETGGESHLNVTGAAATDAVFRVMASGNSGTTHLSYAQVRNSDDKNAWFVVPESGFTPSAYFATADFLTIAVDSGYGVRCNVNGTNNSGWQVDNAGLMTIYGTLASHGINDGGSVTTFNVFPAGGDASGNLGNVGLRWNNIYVVTTHVGDLNLDNEELDSHWTLREATQEGEDPDTLYALNRRTGQKYKVQLASV